MKQKSTNSLVLKILSMLAVFSGSGHIAHAIQKGSNLDAHVHGLSEITIAMADNALDIQFASPAMNLLGFEYKATSHKDIATVKKVESVLLQHNQLFSLSDASCKHVNTIVDLSDHIDTDDHKPHDDHEDHHGHEKHQEHNDHHDHEEHQAHDDHHKHHNNHDDHSDHSDHQEHGASESHSEIVANYSYQCEDASKLSSFKVALFEAFPGIYEIQAFWVMPTEQGSALLKPSNSVIEFR